MVAPTTKAGGSPPSAPSRASPPLQRLEKGHQPRRPRRIVDEVGLAVKEHDRAGDPPLERDARDDIEGGARIARRAQHIERREDIARLRIAHEGRRRDGAIVGDQFDPRRAGKDRGEDGGRQPLEQRGRDGFLGAERTARNERGQHERKRREDAAQGRQGASSCGLHGGHRA